MATAADKAVIAKGVARIKPVAERAKQQYDRVQKEVPQLLNALGAAIDDGKLVMLRRYRSDLETQSENITRCDRLVGDVIKPLTAMLDEHAGLMAEFPAVQALLEVSERRRLVLAALLTHTKRGELAADQALKGLDNSETELVRRWGYIDANAKTGKRRNAEALSRLRVIEKDARQAIADYDRKALAAAQAMIKALKPTEEDFAKGLRRCSSISTPAWARAKASSSPQGSRSSASASRY
jgi:hypothetical protein